MLVRDACPRPMLSILLIRHYTPVTLHHRDLLRRQLVQLIHQPIDQVIGELDPPLERDFLVRDLLRSQPRVQVEHLRDGRDHAVVPRDVGGVFKVERPRQKRAKAPHNGVVNMVSSVVVSSHPYCTELLRPERPRQLRAELLY